LITDIDVVIGFHQVLYQRQAFSEESEAIMREHVVFPIVRYKLDNAFLSIETLESDDYRKGFTDLMDQVNDLRVMGDVFDTDEGDMIGGYTIEPLDQAGIDQHVRVEGDDCLIAVLLKFKEVTGFDIAVDEEHRVGMDFLEFIELKELCSGAVEIIIDGDSDYSIHKNLLIYYVAGDSWRSSVYILRDD
jgi:hypothetical protein